MNLTNAQNAGLDYLNERPLEMRDARWKRLRLATTNSLERLGLVETSRKLRTWTNYRSGRSHSHTDVCAQLSEKGRRHMASTDKLNTDAYRGEINDCRRLVGVWIARSEDEAARWLARGDALEAELATMQSSQPCRA